ncbi:DUF5315 domain-containing protein SCDLUD_002016 [Saccharomycodes ludwigii]|uniref:DUF5315 domain-containing protein n=1 Tax=Saccharomycodes ludwigii TaxID=36035 RepID=UPI001E8692CB|nr:hypothetical protein SCDLUD_002016 [Saccharomycodes ludwigii]KAH3902201.1 hypothetical protein SCDLUD_002016 [Saccharomycodes ludwigii]
MSGPNKNFPEKHKDTQLLEKNGSPIKLMVNNDNTANQKYNNLNGRNGEEDNSLYHTTLKDEEYDDDDDDDGSVRQYDQDTQKNNSLPVEPITGAVANSKTLKNKTSSQDDELKNNTDILGDEEEGQESIRRLYPKPGDPAQNTTTQRFVPRTLPLESISMEEEVNVQEQDFQRKPTYQDKLWSDIDVLDDVKKLSKQEDKNGGFPSNFEQELLKLRQAHVLLLKTLKNGRESVSSENSLFSNGIVSDNNNNNNNNNGNGNNSNNNANPALSKPQSSFNANASSNSSTNGNANSNKSAANYNKSSNNNINSVFAEKTQVDTIVQCLNQLRNK